MMLRLMRRGALLGLLTGLILAGSYVALFAMGLMAVMAWGALTAAKFADSAVMLLIAPASAALVLLCGNLLGLPPGALGGALSGAIIGAAVAAGRRWLSPGRAALLGAFIAALLTLVLHLLAFWYDPDPTVQEYLLSTIIPGLLAVGAGAWVGWRLYRWEV